MGLTFSVGSPERVFTKPFARAVRNWIRAELKDAIALETPDDHYWSDEVAWSGWQDLQDLATEHLPEDDVEHLTSMEAWQGVFLPISIDPCAMEFPNHDTPLDVASLPALVAELKALGAVLGLPIDQEGLRSLAAKYAEDDDLIDDDMEIQTYAQLLLAALEATNRQQPLWVIK